MEAKIFTTPGTVITLSIDAYTEGVVSGRLYAGERRETFHGLLPLLMRIEALLDEEKNVVRAQERRSFAPLVFPKGKLPEKAADRQNGRLATVQLQVRYRQNSTWQGVVLWQEEKRELPFRSALELVTLLYSLLEGKTDGK